MSALIVKNLDISIEDVAKYLKFDDCRFTVVKLDLSKDYKRHYLSGTAEFRRKIIGHVRYSLRKLSEIQKIEMLHESICYKIREFANSKAQMSKLNSFVNVAMKPNPKIHVVGFDSKKECFKISISDESGRQHYSHIPNENILNMLKENNHES